MAEMDLTALHLDVYDTRSGPWNPQHGAIEIPDGWDFLPSGDELTLPGPDVFPLGHKEGSHVCARDGAVSTQVEDAGHPDQGETGRLSAADEGEPGKDRGVVLAVSVGTPRGLGKQTAPLVEADGLAATPAASAASPCA